jgi:hypothetical protein
MVLSKVLRELFGAVSSLMIDCRFSESCTRKLARIIIMHPIVE